jgi:hypothetical protein
VGWKNCFSPVLYRSRNAIERMFCRLKDFRRIATRYDRLAINGDISQARSPLSGMGPQDSPDATGDVMAAINEAAGGRSG